MKKSVILTLCFLGLAVGAVGLALTVPTNPALTFNSVLSDAIALVETREDHAGHDDEGSDDEESQHRIDAATETGRITLITAMQTKNPITTATSRPSTLRMKITKTTTDMTTTAVSI